MMIMGLSVRLAGVRVRGSSLPGMLAPLVLVNLGCGLRVVSQALSDTVPAAYSVIALSGVLELIAFAWWAVVLVRLMWVRRLIEHRTGRVEGALAGVAVAA